MAKIEGDNARMQFECVLIAWVLVFPGAVRGGAPNTRVLGVKRGGKPPALPRPCRGRAGDVFRIFRSRFPERYVCRFQNSIWAVTESGLHMAVGAKGLD